MSSNTTRVSNPMKVITAPGTRWSLANIREPKSINGSALKYSVSLILLKNGTKTVVQIKVTIAVAYQQGQSKLEENGKSVPPLTTIKNPLRDGDVERPDDPACTDADSATVPGIVDADHNPVLAGSAVCSCVYCRASINFYVFNSSGNKGIVCTLNNLQLIHTRHLLVARRAPNPISQPMPTMLFSTQPKEVTHYNNDPDHRKSASPAVVQKAIDDYLGQND